MAYTFGDQLDKLSVLLGDPNTSTDDAFPLATRKKEINRGELRFARDTKALTEYATGTVSGNSITIPSDWIETFILVIDDEVVTNDKEISLSDYGRYHEDTSEYYHYIWEVSGTKYIYFFNSSASGKTYKLWYFKKPTTELSATTDTSSFPEEYREASVFYAAAQLLNQIGKVSLAQKYMTDYATYVTQATQDIEKHRINKEYPRPDFGDDTTDTDHQGQGWIG
jgi:hypothetical protein